MGTKKLSELMRDNDYVGEILATSLTNTPTRRRIDNALLDNGYTIPLTNKVSFHMFDGSKMFIVTWFPHLDKYGYEKLTLK
jgi:hypothetical protein